jgi:hypothetical protein
MMSDSGGRGRDFPELPPDTRQAILAARASTTYMIKPLGDVRRPTA